MATRKNDGPNPAAEPNVNENLTESFSGPGGTHATPGEDVQAAREAAQQAEGADAAMGVSPRKARNVAPSQIRGSFAPGGGAGEDATSLVDDATGVMYPAGTSDEERQRLIDQAKRAAQKQYEDDLANPDIPMVRMPAGVDASNPNRPQG